MSISIQLWHQTELSQVGGGVLPFVSVPNFMKKAVSGGSDCTLSRDYLRNCWLHTVIFLASKIYWNGKEENWALLCYGTFLWLLESNEERLEGGRTLEAGPGTG